MKTKPHATPCAGRPIRTRRQRDDFAFAARLILGIALLVLALMTIILG